MLTVQKSPTGGITDGQLATKATELSFSQAMGFAVGLNIALCGGYAWTTGLKAQPSPLEELRNFRKEAQERAELDRKLDELKQRINARFDALVLHLVRIVSANFSKASFAG